MKNKKKLIVTTRMMIREVAMRDSSSWVVSTAASRL